MRVMNRRHLKGITRGKYYYWMTIKKDIIRNKYVYLMLLPVVAYYLVFEYGPMYGMQIAFKQFSPTRGIWESPWVGFQNFIEFFNSYYFWRIIKNTVLLGFFDLLFGFPAPILLAMLLNEVRSKILKRTVQSVTYVPHFVSLVVVVGILVDFTSKDGVVNQVLGSLGIPSVPFLIRPEWFRFLYVSSDIWQQVGWSSIIYLAAIAGISPHLYEAARVDGANRYQQALHVTIPGILSTIVIMFILKTGHLLSVGAEKIILMYNPSIYETADVISTFVYRKGLLEMAYSYSAAVGLFNSVLNFALLIAANRLSRMWTDFKLW
ncbi:MAG: carbohydrate transporter rane protein 1, family [Paenibacillus sp.]|nr:carbohydrate transporter rane protein 1, family [Paenibacillus sp.]